MAGRYPDDRVHSGDLRTIDIYDSNTAELVCQLHDPTAAGIKSVSMCVTEHRQKCTENRTEVVWGFFSCSSFIFQLNKFNPLGDVIGSGMGKNICNIL